MAFVKANHPELQPLLNQLKSKQEKRFQSVLLTLDADVKRLQRWEKNSPTRYKRGLQQWVINSRVQLLKAQLSLKKNGKERAAIRKKIRAEFEKEHKLHRENTVIAIEAAKKKHERLKQILKDHDANRDSKIERKLAELERSSSQHKKKPEEKSGDKDNSAKGNPNKKQAAAEASKPKHNDGRVDVETPDESLILTKPTDEDNHEGGLRYEKGSWQFNLLTSWINSGASNPETIQKLDRLVVQPAELRLEDPSQKVTLRALALSLIHISEPTRPY